MSSGERAALLATPSRDDGGAFARTTTERDVEAAGSNGVGASSPRSSAWRRRSYLWLTIASTATFAIIMTIVARGVSPSTAVADGGLTTAAAETRATLGARARDVAEDARGDDAALGAREARRRQRVAARAEARADAAREDAAEEASSLSRAPVSAGVAEAREARRERRRATREASRVAEQRKEAKEANVATSTSTASDGLTPRSVRRERRRAERIAKRMIDTRVDHAAADDGKDARSKRHDDASERREERERKDEAKREESERKHKRERAEREKDEKEIEKRRDHREKERKKDDTSDDDAEKRQKEREEKREKLQEKREEIQRKVESKKREIEERQEGREKDRKEDEKDSDDDAEKRQEEREKKRDAGERDAEDKKEEIEKAKKERDHQLDALKRRSEAKKREIEQLKEEARNIHKHDRESADLGEAIKDAVFFTYSDHITGGMCASGETAAMNDIDLQILGARGAKDPFAYPDVKNVKTKKVFAFLHALTNEVWRKKFGIGDDTIVSVGDATDVLYFKHKSEVIRAFEEIETESKVGDNKLVVVSSERNCWPWMIHGKERLPNGTAICASFPDAPSSYKYLNSGSLMGRAKGLAELLRDIVDRMQSVNEDDQMILANAFLRQSTSKTSSDTPYVIALDYMQRLFQTAYDGQLESRNFAQYRAKDAYYDRAHTQVVNTETHTTPVIVHFNGLKANLFPITRHFLVHHGHAEHYAQIKQSWLQTNPFFNASCQPIVDNIKIGIMPPMQKPTHTITPDVERKRLEEER